MGDVVYLIPGIPEIRNELAKLHRLHAALSKGDLAIFNAAGFDVTEQEADSLGLVIDLLERATDPITGKRS